MSTKSLAESQLGQMPGNVRNNYVEEKDEVNKTVIVDLNSSQFYIEMEHALQSPEIVIENVGDSPDHEAKQLELQFQPQQIEHQISSEIKQDDLTSNIQLS